jgi:Tfp pilus assembly protein PilF
MALRSRRIWQFGVLITTLFLFCTPIFAENTKTNPISAFYSYEDLLRMAEEKIITETPTKAFDFLAKAKELNPKLDYRYFNLMGDAHTKLGQIYEAIVAYEESIKRKNDQLDLILTISDLYEKDRKPKDALRLTEVYLEQKPKAKYRLFTAGILSRQVGNENAYERYMSLLEADTSFVSEKEALQTSLSKNLKLHKWKEAEELSVRYLPYFPREEGMYETLILARRGKKSPEVEAAYRWACTIYKTETRYFTRFGVFLQEEKRYLESLASFRRAYFNLLKYHPESDAGEIIFLIRQSYANLGRDRDTLAIDQLVKDFKKKKTLTDTEVENHQQTYRKNREYLLFSIDWFKTKDEGKANFYRTLLEQRDQEFEISEFLNTIGPFALEKMIL